MSSNILHISKPTNKPISSNSITFKSEQISTMQESMIAKSDLIGIGGPATEAAKADGERSPLLTALGERVRDLRARRGLTRRAVSVAAGVSERHLANLESGTGNASFLVLTHVADALHCSLAEIVGDVTTLSPEWLMIRALLEQHDEASLRRVRVALGQLLGAGSGPLGGGVLNDSAEPEHSRKIALIGLRGAGKSTLGRMLAEDLGYPFIELSSAIEKLAGCNVAEIQALYGLNAYRRYERRALEEALQNYPEVVMAIPGGLVSDPGSFNQLLSKCTTVWLQASPADHMGRVVAQGDMRPMATSKEAMDDLKGILSGRTPFYSKAQYNIDTSAQALTETFQTLRLTIREALQLSV